MTFREASQEGETITALPFHHLVKPALEKVVFVFVMEH